MVRGSLKCSSFKSTKCLALNDHVNNLFNSGEIGNILLVYFQHLTVVLCYIHAMLCYVFITFSHLSEHVLRLQVCDCLIFGTLLYPLVLLA